MTSFRDIYRTHLQTANIPPRRLPAGECQAANRRTCFICHASRYDYESETRVKDAAIREFWSAHMDAAPLQPLIASPKGRWYRTVTKRKAFPSTHGPVFGLIESREDAADRPMPVIRCAIEPVEHAAIYAACDEILRHPSVRPLANEVQYIILKGNYHEQTVIFNIAQLENRARHAVNTVSRQLTKRFPSIIGIFIYEDASPGRYYLGTGNPDRRQVLQKIFGKPSIFLKISGRNFLFHPLSFSQVNASMIDTMVHTVLSMLPGDPQATLYDLYAGYGLFSLIAAEQWKRIVGVELSREAVQSARENAVRQHADNISFMRSPVTGDTIQRIMAGSGPRDSVIVDPPRSGTDPGVIDSIAVRRPKQVLHLFCNIDIMPEELAYWRQCGYRIARAVPMDNFPGTDQVEMLVLLEPAE